MSHALPGQVPFELRAMFGAAWLSANSGGVHMFVGQCECGYLMVIPNVEVCRCPACGAAPVHLFPMWMYREGRWKRDRDSAWQRIVVSDQDPDTCAGAPGVESL